MKSFPCRTLGLCAAGVGLTLMAMTPLQAVEPIEQQLNIRNRAAERVRSQQIADQLVELGRQRIANGSYETGIEAWQEAIEIYSRLGNAAVVEDLRESLIAVLISDRRFEGAESLIQQQLLSAQDNNDVAGQIDSLNNLGTVYIQQGKIIQAQRIFAEALELAREDTDIAGLGLTLSNLGLAAWRLNDLDSARTYYEAATNYRLQANDDVGLAHSSNSLGQIYQQLGEDGKALGAYLVARRTALELSHLPTLLVALDGLIDIYRDRGNPEQLRTYINERVAMTPEDAAPAQQLGLYVGLGKYYEQLEDEPRAREAYRRALVLAEQIGDTRQKTFILNRLQVLAAS